MTVLEDGAQITRPERIADRLYHDVLSPAEIAELRARVRDTASRIVAPVAARIANQDERNDGFPHDVFAALAREGLYRIPFDADVDGDGLTHKATATAVVGNGRSTSAHVTDVGPPERRARRS